MNSLPAIMLARPHPAQRHPPAPVTPSLRSVMPATVQVLCWTHEENWVAITHPAAKMAPASLPSAAPTDACHGKM